jgi:hypothetical protein
MAVQQHEQQLQIPKKRPNIISLKKAWCTRPRASSLSKISQAHPGVSMGLFWPSGKGISPAECGLGSAG